MLLEEAKMQTKLCSKCRVVKPVSEFNRCSASYDKLQYCCRECNKAYMFHYHNSKKQVATKPNEEW